MNLQQLRTFYTITREGSFSRAAERLHLTQPTISAQIQALEKQLKTRLFDRTNQGSRLTEAGEILARYARQVLELLDEAETSVQQLKELSTGRIRVIASSVPGNYLLPGRLAAFKSRYPGIEIVLEVTNSASVRRSIRAGEFELGVVGERDEQSQVTYRQVAEDELTPVARAAHPLARRSSLPAAELASWPLLLRERGSGTREVTERALAERGVRPEDLQIFMEFSTAEAMLRAVRESDAIAILSRLAVEDELSRRSIVRLNVPDLVVVRPLYLVTRTDAVLSPAARAFADIL